MYNGELELLRARAQLLGPLRDRVVVVESDRTFTGRPKELVGPEHLKLLDDGASNVHFVRANLPGPDEPGVVPWDRESAQREALAAAIGDVADADDVVLVGDVDELPRPGLLKSLIDHGLDAPRLLHMDYRQYYLNWKMPHVWDVGPILFRWRQRAHPALKVMFGDRDIDPYTLNVDVEPDAGWHVTFLGGPDAVRRKLGDYSHTELDTPLQQRAGFVESCLEHRVELRGMYVMNVMDPSDLEDELLALVAANPAFVRPDPGVTDREAEAFRRMVSIARREGRLANASRWLLARPGLSAAAARAAALSWRPR